ncbi:MAG TPA: DNA polymerase III subunit gamma/tau, partial [Geobacterales bacterium]|nr:DNA polymerase III subunit gamma/tau [Geobacterales bacterium]
LLKTLEEPPPHVTFIFATTEPHKVPVTILSRCQRFDFRRISLIRIVERLRFIVDQEGISISEGSLALVARKGDGSMRDSLSLLDQVLAFCGDQVKDGDVATLLGVVDRRLLLETVQAVQRGDNQLLMEIVSRADDFGYSMRQFIQELIDLFRAILIAATVRNPAELLDMADAELAEVMELAQQGDAATLQRQLTLLLRGEGEVAHSSYPRLVVEMTLLRLATLPTLVPIHEILDRLRAMESGKGGFTPSLQSTKQVVTPSKPKPVPPPAPTSSRPVASSSPPVPAPSPATLTPTSSITASWEGFVEAVNRQKPRIGAFLNEAHPLEFSPQRVAIGFPAGSFYLTSLREADALSQLNQLASSYLKEAVVVEILPLRGDTATAPPTLAESKSRQSVGREENLRQEVASDPMVSATLEIFGGEVSAILEEKKQ